ncbi:MAG TPA: ISL3 family transposase [Planctomycetota bacterium]|nr:ISL3 family transposase [Planctomycetota bacterium]
MRAESVARRLLSFPRLSVGKVRFEADELGDEVLVIEVAVRGRSRCSRCGRKCPGYDRLRPRRWRHLDFGAFEVHIEAALARVECERCGVVVEQVSWAEPESRFTVHFEELVGWLAQRCDKTAISTMMRIAWRTVGTILERVVVRRRQKIDWTKVTAIAVDELSFRKGQHYLTLVSDLETGRILWSKEGRSAATLEAFFAEIGRDACERIRHAAIDMFEAYAQAIRRWLPNATIVYDRFHVQQLSSKAVDEVRRGEWQRLRGSAEARGIKHLRWALLRNPWNVTPAEHERLAALPKQNRLLYRAYLLKESLAGIYRSLYTPTWAKRRLVEWIEWATRSRLAPFRKVARTLRRCFDGVLAYFDTGYTTSHAEGLNTKARLATRQAYGFHSADAVRAMIELRCTGITLQLPHQIVGAAS